MASNETTKDPQAKNSQTQQNQTQQNQTRQTYEPEVETVYAEIDTDPESSEFVAKAYSWLNIARDKFAGLSPGGKIVVGIVGIWFGITSLNMVLHLVSSLITVGILGVILYFAYQKLIVGTKGE